MRRRRSRHPTGNDDNGFAEWGGYMAAKKAKLQEQFELETENNILKKTDIFKGVAIFVNGYTNPTSEELKLLMAIHGGVFHYYESSRTTHIIASNLPDTKIKQLGKSIPVVKPEWITESISKGKLLDYRNYLLYTNQSRKQPRLQFPTITKAVNSEVENNKPLESNQATYSDLKQMKTINDDSYNHSVKHKKYSFVGIFEENSPRKKGLNNIDSKNKDNSESNIISKDDNQENSCISSKRKLSFQLSPDIFEFDFSDIEHAAELEVQTGSEHINNNSDMNSDSSDISNKAPDAEQLKQNNDQNLEVKLDELVQKENKSTAIEAEANTSKLHQVNLNTKHQGAKITRTAADPKFLSEFYQNSRLHLISTLGAEFKQLVNHMRDKWDGKFPGREKLLQKFADRPKIIVVNSVVMHIDMDCFFVSVGLRNRPDLRGKPVAVTHARGSHNVNRNESSLEAERALYKKYWPGEDSSVYHLDQNSSMSEVASCSYEARKCGVKNGMFLGIALKMCPELQTIPYDFQGYREVSSTLYQTVAKYTLDIEAVSCDEMYVDVGPLLKETGMTVEEWATHIRSEIMEITQCPCSTGFGSNRLQARLATRKAKPAGQFYLKPDDVEDYMAEVSLADLPGVGIATVTKLKNLGLTTCGDVQQTSLQRLQAELGTKLGEQVYEQAKGIDPKPLNFYHERKSVSADVNYGIRFKKYEEALDFLQRLSEEVYNRLEETGMKARCLTLKVLVRAPDAPQETAKYLGCGVCNSINRSTTKGNLICDAATVYKEAKYLLDQVKAPPEDFRGIGIQLTRLEKVGPVNKVLSNFLKQNAVNTNNETVKQKNEEIKEIKDLENEKKDANSEDHYKNNQRNSDVKEISNMEDLRNGDNLEQAPLASTDHVNPVSKIAVQNKSKRGRPKGKGTAKANNTSNCVGTLKIFFNVTSRSDSSFSNKQKEEQNLRNIDMSVLKELPDELQSEILREYGISPVSVTKKDDIHIPEQSSKMEQQEKCASEECIEKDSDMIARKLDLQPSTSKKRRSFTDLNWDELKALIKSWIDSETKPAEVDITMLGEYFKDLAINRKIEKLQILINFLYRNINNLGKCVWHEAYFTILNILQQGMVARYGNTLLVPRNFSCAQHS